MSFIPVDLLPHAEFDDDGELANNVIRQIAKELHVVLEELNESTPSCQSQGGNYIYAGLGGIAWTFLAAGDVARALAEAKSSLSVGDAKDYYERAWSLSERSRRALEKEDDLKRRHTFLEGPLGILAIQIAIVSRQIAEGYRSQADVSIIDNKINQVKKMAETASAQLPAGDCELLYGRCGVLYGLRYVCAQVPRAETKLVEIILKLVGQIVESGLASAEKANAAEEAVYVDTGASLDFPLIFRWHDKEYVGACHGYVGIAQVLCLVKDALGDREIPLPPTMTQTAFHEALTTLTESIFTKALLPSGNLPSSLPLAKASDRLVQWCHGAPGGLVTLRSLLQSASLNMRSKHIFQEAVEKLSSVVRERGCVPRLGMCHGLGGNGLALLKAAKISRNPKMVRRAAQYAIYGFERRKALMKAADRPLSLFEGLAGLAVLQLALISHGIKEIEFPGYDIC